MPLFTAPLGQKAISANSRGNGRREAVGKRDHIYSSTPCADSPRFSVPDPGVANSEEAELADCFGCMGARLGRGGRKAERP